MKHADLPVFQPMVAAGLQKSFLAFQGVPGVFGACDVQQPLTAQLGQVVSGPVPSGIVIHGHIAQRSHGIHGRNGEVEEGYAGCPEMPYVSVLHGIVAAHDQSAFKLLGGNLPAQRGGQLTFGRAEVEDQMIAEPLCSHIDGVHKHHGILAVPECLGWRRTGPGHQHG